MSENLWYRESRKTQKNKDFIQSLEKSLEDSNIDTREAKELREKYEEIREARNQILAITKDELKSLARWLNIDENSSLGKTLNKLIEKSQDQGEVISSPSASTDAGIATPAQDITNTESIEDGKASELAKWIDWVEYDTDTNNYIYKWERISRDDIENKDDLINWVEEIEDKIALDLANWINWVEYDENGNQYKYKLEEINRGEIENENDLEAWIDNIEDKIALELAKWIDWVEYNRDSNIYTYKWEEINRDEIQGEDELKAWIEEMDKKIREWLIADFWIDENISEIDSLDKSFAEYGLEGGIFNLLEKYNSYIEDKLSWLKPEILEKIKQSIWIRILNLRESINEMEERIDSLWEQDQKRNYRWILNSKIQEHFSEINNKILPSALLLLQHTNWNIDYDKIDLKRPVYSSPKGPWDLGGQTILRYEELSTKKKEEKIKYKIAQIEEMFSASLDYNWEFDEFWIETFNQSGTLEIDEEEDLAIFKGIWWDRDSLADIDFLNEADKEIETEATIAYFSYVLICLVPYIWAAAAVPSDLVDLFSNEEWVSKILREMWAINEDYRMEKSLIDNILWWVWLLLTVIWLQWIARWKKLVKAWSKLDKIWAWRIEDWLIQMWEKMWLSQEKLNKVLSFFRKENMSTAVISNWEDLRVFSKFESLDELWKKDFLSKRLEELEKNRSNLNPEELEEVNMIQKILDEGNLWTDSKLLNEYIQKYVIPKVKLENLARLNNLYPKWTKIQFKRNESRWRNNGVEVTYTGEVKEINQDWKLVVWWEVPTRPWKKTRFLLNPNDWSIRIMEDSLDIGKIDEWVAIMEKLMQKFPSWSKVEFTNQSWKILRGEIVWHNINWHVKIWVKDWSSISQYNSKGEDLNSIKIIERIPYKKDFNVWDRVTIETLYGEWERSIIRSWEVLEIFPDWKVLIRRESSSNQQWAKIQIDLNDPNTRISKIRQFEEIEYPKLLDRLKNNILQITDINLRNKIKVLIITPFEKLKDLKDFSSKTVNQLLENVYKVEKLLLNNWSDQTNNLLNSLISIKSFIKWILDKNSKIMWVKPEMIEKLKVLKVWDAIEVWWQKNIISNIDWNTIELRVILPDDTILKDKINLDDLGNNLEYRWLNNANITKSSDEERLFNSISAVDSFEELFSTIRANWKIWKYSPSRIISIIKKYENWEITEINRITRQWWLRDKVARLKNYDFIRDDDTLAKLWPRGLDSITKQWAVWNCYFVASLNALKNHPRGWEMLKNMIKETKDWWIVKFAWHNETIKITKSSLDEMAEARQSSDNIWDIIIERAHARVVNKQRWWNSWETMMVRRNGDLIHSWGQMKDTIRLFFWNRSENTLYYYSEGRIVKSKDFERSEYMASKSLRTILSRNLDVDNLITISSKFEKWKTDKYSYPWTDFYWREIKIVYGHAYSVSNFSYKEWWFSVVNPHDSWTEIRLKIDDFDKYFSGITVSKFR